VDPLKLACFVFLIILRKVFKSKGVISSAVETYYCLRRAVGNDLMFEVEVINPKDNQRDVAKED